MNQVEIEDEIFYRCKQALNGAVVDLDPFPHFYIRDFLAENIYSQLRRNFPEDDQFKRSDAKRTSNVAALLHRRKIQLVDETISSWNRESSTIFGAISNVFRSRDFSLCVQAQFEAQIADRYGQKYLPTFTRVELNRDEDGYEIKPHTDAPHKVFTLIFYLPDDDTNSAFGTYIYQPKVKSFTSEAPTQFDSNLFEIRKALPYKPNTVFGFMKTDRSFHGRPAIKGLKGHRDWMNISIQVNTGSRHVDR